MVCLDGVYISYIAESTEIPEQEMVDEYLPPYRPSFRIAWGYKLFYKEPPPAVSTNPMDGMFFMYDRYELHKMESQCLNAMLKANKEFEELFGRGYPPVEQYKCDDANVVVVMTGSPAGTARDVIDRLRDEGHKIGLVKLRVFRPFPKELVRDALRGRKKVAVIERDISPGQCGIFYQEIKWALYKDAPDLHIDVPMYGFVSGMGGGDITPRLIEKAILFTVEKDPPPQEAIWLGLGEMEVNDGYDQNTVKIS
jgi:pyruvate/2-oxoacid:ferredoxin oxidoreductase alpha subunit